MNGTRAADAETESTDEHGVADHPPASAVSARVTSVFTDATALRAIKTTVALSVVLGLGVGIAGYALVSATPSRASVSALRALLGAGVVTVVTVSGPALAGALALRVAPTLAAFDPLRRYVTLAVSGCVGSLLYTLIAGIVVGTYVGDAGGINVGVFVHPFVVAALGAAVVAVGTVAAERWLAA